MKFNCSGDIGNGTISLRSHTNVEDESKNVDIQLSEPVALTFSLKYLVNFCKASGLSDQVKLCLSNEVPLLVEYQLSNNSYLRFYLAPKVRLFHYTLLSRIKLTYVFLDRRRRVDEQSAMTMHEAALGSSDHDGKRGTHERGFEGGNADLQAQAASSNCMLVTLHSESTDVIKHDIFKLALSFHLLSGRNQRLAKF